MPAPLLGPVLGGIARAAAGTEAAAFARGGAMVLENTTIANARTLTAALGRQGGGQAAGQATRQMASADFQAAMSGSGGTTTQSLASGMGRELPDAVAKAFNKQRMLTPTPGQNAVADMSGWSHGELQQFDKLREATEIHTQVVRDQNRRADQERQDQSQRQQSMRLAAQSFAGGGLGGLTARPGNGDNTIKGGAFQMAGSVAAMGLAGPAAVPAGMIGLTLGFAKLASGANNLSDRLLQAQEPLRRFSGAMAVAFARLEHDRLVRSWQSAQATSGTTSTLAASTSALEDTLRPYRDFATNAKNAGAASFDRLVTVGIQGLDTLLGIKTIMEWVALTFGWNKPVHQNLPFNNFADPWRTGRFGQANIPTPP